MAEEKYVCDECGKEFDSQRGLSIHENVHEDEQEEEQEETKSGRRIITH